VVFYNKEQTLLRADGFQQRLLGRNQGLGEKLVKELSVNRPVVGPSASCIGMIRNYYPEFFHNLITPSAIQAARCTDL
jgi:L-lactate dehydrogenase complex protein LldE